MTGNAFFDSNRFDQAITAYKKSLELDPDNANVWTDMGVMYRRNGQPEKAIEAFNKAIEIDAKHEKSRFNKGVVLMHDLGDSEGALSAWVGLTEINPFAKTPDGRTVIELVNSLKQGMK